MKLWMNVEISILEALAKIENVNLPSKLLPFLHCLFKKQA
jgi:hypothetical protein